MSTKKRMGNDPFENPPSIREESKNESNRSSLEKKNPTPNNSSIKKAVAAKFNDENGDILGKLDLALRNIATQKEEIDSLRNELNALKIRSNNNKNSILDLWLRFWFPWFPR